MAHARSHYPTLYEILKTVRPLGASGGGNKHAVSAVDGITPRPVPQREGLSLLSPEQLVSVRVPIQKMSEDQLKGYQRHLRVARAREFARFLVSTPNHIKVLPVVEISIDGHGNAFFTDGQHRGAGAVIARKSLRVIITKRSETEARKLFSLQAKASKPSRNVLILDGDGPFEEYIQDAVTSDEHPWNKLITMSHTGTSKTKMSASSALSMLRVYVARTSQMSGTPTLSENEKFDRRVADDLAVLVSAFGNKATNPAAFSATSLRAIAVTARQVFREREPHPEDKNRWVLRMNKFNFAQYSYLRSYPELADRLLKYWDKGLPPNRRVITRVA